MQNHNTKLAGEKFHMSPWPVQLEHHPVTERMQVQFSILGTCLGCQFDPWSRCIQSLVRAHMGEQPINASLSHRCVSLSILISCPLFLKAMEKCPWMSIKNKFQVSFSAGSNKQRIRSILCKSISSFEAGEGLLTYFSQA